MLDTYFFICFIIFFIGLTGIFIFGSESTLLLLVFLEVMYLSIHFMLILCYLFLGLHYTLYFIIVAIAISIVETAVILAILLRSDFN